MYKVADIFKSQHSETEKGESLEVWGKPAILYKFCNSQDSKVRSYLKQTE